MGMLPTDLKWWGHCPLSYSSELLYSDDVTVMSCRSNVLDLGEDNGDGL